MGGTGIVGCPAALAASSLTLVAFVKKDQASLFNLNCHRWYFVTNTLRAIYHISMPPNILPLKQCKLRNHLTLF